MVGAPQDLYQWLSAVSVIVAGSAVKYAVGLSNRFIKLETRFEEKATKVKEIESQQKLDSALLAVHSKQLETLSSINEKLDDLPRREELDVRFKGIEGRFETLESLFSNHTRKAN
jgi:hypothetical protein